MRTLLLASVAALSLAAPAFAQSGDGNNRVVTITNATSYPIVGIYASRVGVHGWQENMLYGRRIAPGNSARANIDDGSGSCHYDFKAVHADGKQESLGDVNVCAVHALTINGE